MPDTKLRPTTKQDVNASNRNSYVNIICIKFVTQARKNLKKTKTQDFYLSFLRF